MDIIGTAVNGDFIIAMTQEEVTVYERFLSPPELSEKDVVLNVPHLSQYGYGADERKRDCGAAVAAMALRLLNIIKTVDDISVQFQPEEDENMRFGDVIMAIRHYGMKAVYKRQFKAADIEAAIRNGHPVIALVKYPIMPYQALKFSGYHFIVVYGARMDGSLLYRDPLAPDGTLISISATALDRAMSEYPMRDNQHFQAIITG